MRPAHYAARDTEAAHDATRLHTTAHALVGLPSAVASASAAEVCARQCRTRSDTLLEAARHHGRHSAGCATLFATLSGLVNPSRRQRHGIQLTSLHTAPEPHRRSHRRSNGRPPLFATMAYAQLSSCRSSPSDLGGTHNLDVVAALARVAPRTPPGPLPMRTRATAQHSPALAAGFLDGTPRTSRPSALSAPIAAAVASVRPGTMRSSALYPKPYLGASSPSPQHTEAASSRSAQSSCVGRPHIRSTRRTSTSRSGKHISIRRLAMELRDAAGCPLREHEATTQGRQQH